MGEQIIIDGINVVDCNYIIDHDPPKERGTWGGAIHKGACKVYSKDCKYNPNCYFKQLARKTQECELAEQLITGILKTLNLEAYDWRADQNEILTEIRAFKQECEQKDKEIKGLHLIIDRLLEASGYDKHISSAEDFEDVYKDMDYKLGLIDELKQECEELKDKLKCKIQEYIKLSKEYRRLKDWSHTKAVEIKVNGKIKETNLEEFCRLFQFKEIQARENKLKEWQDFGNDLQWKFYENCKEWTEMRDSRDRYRKALEEIEEVLKDEICEECPVKEGCKGGCKEHQCLDIINKAKGEMDE